MSHSFQRVAIVAIPVGRVVTLTRRITYQVVGIPQVKILRQVIQFIQEDLRQPTTHGAQT